MKEFWLFIIALYISTNSYSKEDTAMLAQFEKNESKIIENRELACTSVSLELYSRDSLVSSGLNDYLNILRKDNGMSNEEADAIAEMAFKAISAAAYVGCSQGQKNAWAIENYPVEYKSYLPVVNERFKAVVEMLKEEQSINAKK
jgi:hypothetical protein